MTPLPNYEIYAIKYAEHHRMSKDNFLGGDAHDHPMPLDYYIWVIRHERQVWVFDTFLQKRQSRGGVISSVAQARGFVRSVLIRMQ